MIFGLFPSLQGYERSWLRGDLIAGLTVWAVLIPESLAYASIAGVSPVIGLYAAPPALVLYAAFGSSRHLIAGPMSATAALSAAAVASVASAGTQDYVAFTAALAILTGLIAIGAGLLRLGFLASFISEPVLKGFIIGLALTIMMGQLPKLFGIEKSSGEFFEQLGGFVRDLGDTHGLTLAVGVSSLALVLLLRRFAPVVPASLAAVAFGLALVELFDLGDHGVDVVGHIASGLPSPGLPDGLGFHDYVSVVGSAAGVMLVGFAEGLGAAKTYATRAHYEIDANRELLGLGAANLGAGLSAGMVVNGSLSKTAVNGGAGAKSQVSGLVVAAMTVVTLLFLTGLFEDLPEATLAAIVIAAVIELVDVEALVRLYRLSTGELARIYGVVTRADFIAAMAALAGVLVFGTLPGLFIGIVVSALLLLYRSSRPHLAVLGLDGDASTWVDVHRHPEARPEPGILVVRPESPLFYANADNIRRAVLDEVTADIHAVVLDAETVPAIDVSAADMLRELSTQLGERHVRFVLARDVGQVRDLLSRVDDDDPIPSYPTVRDAIASVKT